MKNPYTKQYAVQKWIGIFAMVFFGILFIIVLAAIGGCNAEKHHAKVCNRILAKYKAKCPDCFKTKDTTVTHYKDTTITNYDTVPVPANSGIGSFNVDSIINAYKASHKEVTVTKHFKGGSITLTDSAGIWKGKCKEDSLREVIKVKNKIKIRDDSTIHSLTLSNQVIKVIPKTTFEIVEMVGFWFFIAAILLYLIYLYLKDKIKSPL